MTLKVYSKMEIGGDRSMKERTYVCCDLNNAEGKEMPISFGST